MEILITGSKGQLGSDAVKVLGRFHEIMAVDLEELDITNPEDVEAMVRDFRPDVILNCAAFTNVDACETQRDIAWKVNVEGPRNLALSVKKNGGLLIHISTDYVFSGKKPPPEAYLEDDEPGPISFYGKTKLEAEAAVRQATDRHCIVRTAWLYGIAGHNFLKTMLKLAMRGPQKEIKVVSDQFGSPTWSYQLAVQIAKIIEIDGRGIYHATAEGCCTWYDLACYFLTKMDVPHTLIPCTSEEYLTPAKRPRNSILENRRLKSVGINLMKDWRENIDQFVSQFGKRLRNDVLKEL